MDLCFKVKLEEKHEVKIKNWFKRWKGGKYRKTQLVRKKVEFCGVGVLPPMEDYQFEVRGYGKLDYFALTSCHEETSVEGLKKKVDVTYTPTIERSKSCHLYVSAYNRRQRHGWGLLAFEDPRYKLEAILYCNGYESQVKGVSVCQSREGLLQKIVFKEKVKLVNPVNGAAERHDNCPEIGTDYKKEYEFLIPPRECVYGFIGKKSDAIHRLLVIGYEDVIVRH